MREAFYLGGGLNGRSILQQQFNDFYSILLARDVQRRETVLQANKYVKYPN